MFKQEEDGAMNDDIYEKIKSEELSLAQLQALEAGAINPASIRPQKWGDEGAIYAGE